MGADLKDYCKNHNLMQKSFRRRKLAEEVWINLSKNELPSSYGQNYRIMDKVEKITVVLCRFKLISKEKSL